MVKKNMKTNRYERKTRSVARCWFQSGGDDGGTGGAAVVATGVCGLQNAARHRSKWPAAALVDGRPKKRAKFKTVHAQNQTAAQIFKGPEGYLRKVDLQVNIMIFQFSDHTSNVTAVNVMRAHIDH